MLYALSHVPYRKSHIIDPVFSELRVFNNSRNPGTTVTNTQLVIRGRNKKGNIVYSRKVKIQQIPGKSHKIAEFKKVNIPKSEITLYYIKATADIDNSEDEFKEDNNSASILRVIDQDCE